MPVKSASLSITTSPSSAAVANVPCSGCLDPRSTTGPNRRGNQRCGSLQGSMLSICKIAAAVASGWWAIWPEMGSRSALSGSENSCAVFGYGRSTRIPAPLCPRILSSVFHDWWISARSRLWIRCVGYRYHLHPEAEGLEAVISMLNAVHGS